MSELIFEEGLGSRSSQKIIALLTIWETLSVEDIILKTGISKSQVHVCLKNLLNNDLLKRKTKGIYTLSDSNFMNLLGKAYETKINQIISEKINEIQKLIKLNNYNQAELLFNALVDQYTPILDKNFGLIISSLSHEFIDNIIN